MFLERHTTVVFIYNRQPITGYLVRYMLPALLVRSSCSLQNTDMRWSEQGLVEKKQNKNDYISALKLCCSFIELFLKHVFAVNV